MAAGKKDSRKQIKALKRAHDRRAELVTKVAKAREKFEKRTKKLQEVEARIAELSREVYGTPAAAAPAEADAPAVSENKSVMVPPSELASTTSADQPEKVTELPDDPAASE